MPAKRPNPMPSKPPEGFAIPEYQPKGYMKNTRAFLTQHISLPLWFMVLMSCAILIPDFIEAVHKGWLSVALFFGACALGWIVGAAIARRALRDDPR